MACEIPDDQLASRGRQHGNTCGVRGAHQIACCRRFVWIRGDGDDNLGLRRFVRVWRGVAAVNQFNRGLSRCRFVENVAQYRRNAAQQDPHTIRHTGAIVGENSRDRNGLFDAISTETRMCGEVVLRN